MMSYSQTTRILLWPVVLIENNDLVSKMFPSERSASGVLGYKIILRGKTPLTAQKHLELASSWHTYGLPDIWDTNVMSHSSKCIFLLCSSLLFKRQLLFLCNIVWHSIHQPFNSNVYVLAKVPCGWHISSAGNSEPRGGLSCISDIKLINQFIKTFNHDSKSSFEQSRLETETIITGWIFL